MAETLVLCGGASFPAKHVHAKPIELDIARRAHRGARVDFKTSRLSARLVDDLPDVLADVVELAVYVYSADRLTKRGSSSSAGIGSEWQRQFCFVVPVRRPDLWKRVEVKTALVDTISFMSGDEFAFDFIDAKAPEAVEPHLGFHDAGAQVIQPDLVMMFSGGLDSLAGVAHEVFGKGRRAVLVTHQSANTIMNRQDELADTIAKRGARNQTFYAPVRVRRGTDQPKEHSQRLRSFLFGALGMAYARMFGLNTVHYFENGITSFNLPIAEHVVGTRASRTTHPGALARMGRLFSHLLDETVTFENPFIWRTKPDIVRLIGGNGCAELIPLTTSCAGVRNLSMTGLQCGICSQCVERRFAILGAGQEALEPAAVYATDIFTQPQEDVRAATMVERYVARAEMFSGMSEHAFFSNYGQVFRALSNMVGPRLRTAQQIFGLHRRHGQEVLDVTNEQLGRYATIAGRRLIAHTSLLGMLEDRAGPAPIYVDPTETEPPASSIPANPKREPFQVVLAVDEKKVRILFRGGAILRGSAFELIATLVRLREEDWSAQRRPANYTRKRTKALAEMLATSDQDLRQWVLRARRSLEKQFEQSTGYTLDKNDVIESGDSWDGYYLNPHVVIVQPAQIELGPPLSRLSGRSITTQPLGH
ncbi:MAG TPA: hypothetical protein VGN97_08230 [Mesorhizobium sp.]|jgi:hypothetical protein|nr:hypothetical protein [Mesorhizobium sp.]